jgi:mono/diheme cytochrome c family protein
MRLFPTIFFGLSHLLLSACIPEPQVVQADFTTFCVACHGISGRGNGELAKELPKRPADLTRISARNGGAFPTARIMSVIDGYSRGLGANGPMPEFGEVLQGATVLYDSGDGILTPTPERLVELVEYLKSIQRP